MQSITEMQTWVMNERKPKKYWNVFKLIWFDYQVIPAPLIFLKTCAHMIADLWIWVSNNQRWKIELWFPDMTGLVTRTLLHNCQRTDESTQVQHPTKVTRAFGYRHSAERVIDFRRLSRQKFDDSRELSSFELCSFVLNFLSPHNVCILKNVWACDFVLGAFLLWFNQIQRS